MYRSKHNKRYYLQNGLIFLHIVFAVIGFYLYILNYQTSQALLIQKTLNKQLIIAKAGSTAVENLLENVQNQLSSFTFSFAQINENAPIDKNATRTEFMAYMARSQLPITGIALFDENGKLSIIENRPDIRFGEGEDFSHSEFIIWSKDFSNKNKILVSGPYIGTAGSSVGKIILIAAKPVYFGNRYKGVLTIRIRLDDLRKAFISPLTTDNDEDSFIVNDRGYLIAGRNDLLNKNLFTYARQQKWNHYKDFIKQFGTAIHQDRTEGSWIFQYPNDQPKELLVGVSIIDLPNTDKDLYMVTTATKETVLLSLRPLRGYGVLWLGFGVFVTVISGIIIMRLKNSD